MDYVTKKRIEALKEERKALKKMRTANLLGAKTKFTETQIESRLETIRKQLDDLTPARLKIKAIDYVTERSLKAEAHVKYIHTRPKGCKDITVDEYKKYVEQNLQMRQIAIEMGVSEYVLYKSRKAWAEQGLIQEKIARSKEKMSLEQYLECAAKGMTSKEIAKLYNITIATFYTKCKR